MNIFVTIILLFLISKIDSKAISNLVNFDDEDPAITRFRDYLRIPTNYPNPDYESAIDWLKSQSEEIGLEFHRLDFDPPAEFAIWLTWTGSDPTLKSILINSHMDVVAVDESKWDYPPFEAYKDAEGNIFARGASDMKSSTAAALEAVRKLKATGFVPLRTIHICVMPDEEDGGDKGMKVFVQSAEFQNLNVGFDMDEMGSSPIRAIGFEYGQKSNWQFNFTARGISEHGSNMPEVTAAHRIQIVIDRLMAYRTEQYELMQQPGTTISDVTSLNLAKMGGGLADNIIADELWASFDMRIRVTPEWTFSDVEAFLDSIVQEAGPEYVSYTFISKSMETGETTHDDTNPWWRALKNGCTELDILCIPFYLYAATDGRYVRSVGIDTFGVNPFTNALSTAHMDNEYLNEQVFLDGIDRYVTFISTVSSVSRAESP